MALTLTGHTLSARGAADMSAASRTGHSPTAERAVPSRENSIRDWVELLAANGIVEEETNITTSSRATLAADPSTREYEV